jgi:DNA invertase Pin-like site-specific DNA recombinase
MTESELRLDALVRVSQRGGREGESFRSPTQQREVIERWVSANDAKVVAWYESIDVSGKTMARADVTAALERIKSGQTDGVIIAWLNRLSRAPVREALTVLEEVRAAGGRIVAVDMAGLDPNDATGEMALTTLLAVNRMQWRQVAERWDMHRRDAIARGIQAVPRSGTSVATISGSSSSLRRLRSPASCSSGRPRVRRGGS